MVLLPSISALPLDPFILRQIQAIEGIIRDETWLEGERRGCCVSPEDPAVRENVCRVVLRLGQQLRESTIRAIAAETRPALAA